MDFKGQVLKNVNCQKNHAFYQQKAGRKLFKNNSK